MADLVTDTFRKYHPTDKGKWPGKAITITKSKTDYSSMEKSIPTMWSTLSTLQPARPTITKDLYVWRFTPARFVNGPREEERGFVGKEKGMTEHVHEWSAQMVSDGPFGSEATDITADCDECGEMLSWEEIDRRLNAVESLKKLIADLQDANNDGPNEMGGPFVAVSVIASALEENDKAP